MKHHNSLLAVLTTLSLAACGGSGHSPAPADNDEANPSGNDQTAQSRNGEPQNLSALLRRVSMSSDDTYEPDITADAGDTLRLDGALVEGEWSDRGASGISFGRSGFAPAASFRCAIADDAVLVAVSTPRTSAADDEAAAGTVAAQTADAEIPDGSLITASGVATGTFNPSERNADIYEMSIPSDHPALVDLNGSERLGVAIGANETRLMPMSDLLLAELNSCTSLAG